ncbi:MAG TPA: hydroxymethylbilane synthase [Acidimicrobiales bacterium]|nr:hydroxymethylbilane synthase [Acidimicrobiales bacterium]
MLRAATRGSALARWQTDHVIALLGVDVEVVVVSTEGDRRTDVPIEAIGGRGVFVKEVQAAVLDGRADFAVHSAKDLPSSTEQQPEGLVIGCIPERGDPRDVLVGSTLDGLPVGGLVATGSVRRRAQLANLRPDLSFTGLRGNIETRLAKAKDFDAIVMAAAALHRLDKDDEIAELLAPEVLVPQVAQGALAIECRADDADVLSALAAIEHTPSRRAVDAERAFLAELGGGCDLPVGALAQPTGDDGRALELRGLIASYDGRIVLRDRVQGIDPAALGRELATVLLDGAGARVLLDGSLGR